MAKMPNVKMRRENDSTWQRIQNRGVENSVHYQDIYEDQQIEYGELGKQRKGTGFKLFAALIGFVVYSLAWCLFSVLGLLSSMLGKGQVPQPDQLLDSLTSFGFLKFVAAVAVAGAAWGGMHAYLMRQVKTQNMETSTKDLKQAKNDAYIQPPEQVEQAYNLFPDVGAHSSVSPTSLIGHRMLTNKGLKPVEVAKRSPETVYDEDGDVVVYKGQELTDENGNVLTQTVDMIDEEFGKGLFEASGVPDSPKLRRFQDPVKIDYNKSGRDRDKLSFNTAADLINDEWELPLYEPQRPAGAYIVDTAPVNTMVLAITRAGKGQTIIEPTIDMWMREKRPNNIVINDPKGELLVKNFVRASRRGYQVVQFNLINPSKTNIYNPLGLAAEAAREGDFGKCAAYVEDISEVFFPTDAGDSDPMWANAAANAFKRSAYGMIDFYLEEERELRKRADDENMDANVLEQLLDTMWGKLTLYNCYQFFVQLSSKKMKSPLTLLLPKVKDEDALKKYYAGWSSEQISELVARAEKESELWNGEQEMDMMSLYFEATARMPKNDSRDRVLDAHNSLVSMAGSDKMIASVYGIAVTAMAFFTDPTIARLTSGPPSQNTDLASLSFPRRFGVRFDANFAKKYSLAGLQAKWEAFEDDTFSKSLGEDFYHEDTVTSDGWARYYFDGKFKNEDGYIRLQLFNDRTGTLNREFFFKFTKGYQTNLTGRSFVRDPITNESIVRNGVLVELVPITHIDKSVTYEVGTSTFKAERLAHFDKEQPDRETYDAAAIMSKSARYSEQPKIIFLVTPPHLMKYAKLILILLRQLVNLNFDKSYLTKPDQKPLYATRFMLDEFGNLQSEGKGVGNVETFLSIGLGQLQQFTLILQTMAQLLAVYGDGVDKIMKGNINNLIFLKSTDDQMIEQLSKMSGERHVVSRGSRTITKNMNKIVNQNDQTISYTDSSQKEATLSYNDFAFIGKCQSIVFRSGDMPIWNRGEMSLPMSFKLFGGKAEKSIVHYGHSYTLQTVPTLSEASGFDIRLNQPNFREMYLKRMRTGWNAEVARRIYMNAYGYDEFSIQVLDPNVVAMEVMEIVDNMKRESSENMTLPEGADVETGGENLPDGDINREADKLVDDPNGVVDNPEFDRDKREAEKAIQEAGRMLYAGGRLSKDSLVTKESGVSHQLDEVVIESYCAMRNFFEKDRRTFVVEQDGSLYSRETHEPFISKVAESESLQRLNEAGENTGNRVYMDGRIEEDEVALRGQYKVHDAFYRFLTSMDSWLFAEQRFEQAMSARMALIEDYDEVAA